MTNPNFARAQYSGPPLHKILDPPLRPSQKSFPTYTKNCLQPYPDTQEIGTTHACAVRNLKASTSANKKSTSANKILTSANKISTSANEISTSANKIFYVGI